MWHPGLTKSQITKIENIKKLAFNPHQADVSESLIPGGSNMPHKGNRLYWLYFCILCNKKGSRDSGETKVDPICVQDPPWSFNGPCHGPTIHPTWPFIYWLYFCIICNKNGTKGLWRHKGQPSLVLRPPLVLQWTLPLPYNTPDLAILDYETSAWLGLGWIELK